MAYRSWCRFRRWTIWIGWCCSWTIAGICPIDLLLSIFLKAGGSGKFLWLCFWGKGREGCPIDLLLGFDLLEFFGNREKRDLEVTWCCFGAKSAVPFLRSTKISRWRVFVTSMGSVVTIQLEVRSFPWCMWNHCFQSWWVDEMMGFTCKYDRQCCSQNMCHNSVGPGWDFDTPSVDAFQWLIDGDWWGHIWHILTALCGKIYPSQFIDIRYQTRPAFFRDVFF